MHVTPVITSYAGATLGQSGTVHMAVDSPTEDPKVLADRSHTDRAVSFRLGYSDSSFRISVSMRVDGRDGGLNVELDPCPCAGTLETLGLWGDAAPRSDFYSPVAQRSPQTVNGFGSDEDRPCVSVRVSRFGRPNRKSVAR